MPKRIILLLLIFIFLIFLSLKEKNNGSIVLIGGGECSEAIQWMLNKTKDKKLLILSYDEEIMYWTPKWQDKATIELLVISSREIANSQETINKIENAQALLISGGIQSEYIRLWKGTKLAKAISLAAIRIPVGGTSAGLAIMGEYYYSAEKDTVISDDALSNPYNEYMSSIESNFLSLPYMKGIITDSHYSERNRYGRHLAFIARILCDNKFSKMRGVGVDEDTGICVNSRGFAVVLGSGKCYMIENMSFPEKCIINYLLIWNNAVKVCTFGHGDKFDFKNWNFKGWQYWNIPAGKLLR